MNKKIFLATGNKHKVEEISKILQDIPGLTILSILDGIDVPEVIEDGETFYENSLKKASEIAKYLNMITIADDSGLCVEALNGDPGVHSARYSEMGTTESNNEKLMVEMKDKENRNAKFVSVITLAFPNGTHHSFRGEINGEILKSPRGTNGFGYDPYFYLKEYDKTFAEMTDTKNKISHRARALSELKKNISKIL